MKTRGYAAIGLVGCKNKHNSAGALRAAQCYGANLIAIQGNRLPNGAANTMQAQRHIPTLLGDDIFALQPYDCQAVAIELVDGAKSLVDFVHPQRAMYIFGPEDGSIPTRIVERCQHVIQVPTSFCMNLSATVNVVLYDRVAKQIRAAAERGSLAA